MSESRLLVGQLLAGFSFLALVACSSTPGEDGQDVDGTGGDTSEDPVSGSGGAPLGGGTGGTSSASGGEASQGTGGEGSGGVPFGPSAGCGDPHTGEPRGDYSDHTILGDREYFVRLPADYDETRAYPLVFWGPGCGASGSEPTVITGSLGSDAILVFLVGKVPSTPQCFDTDDSLAERSPELAYFDAVLSEVQDSYCTEKSRVFVSGYSSGSWLSHLLACHRGNVIRGIGTAAGGLHPPVQECVGKVAAILHAGTADGSNPINVIDEFGYDHGSMGARDKRIEQNGCNPDVSVPWHEAYPDCVIFQEGCPEYPVVWCVDGSNHSAGGEVSGSGFWKFWSELPDVP